MAPENKPALIPVVVGLLVRTGALSGWCLCPSPEPLPGQSRHVENICGMSEVSQQLGSLVLGYLLLGTLALQGCISGLVFKFSVLFFP